MLEGIGAALVLPAMVALVAASFEGQQRALAYGVLGGVAGAGIAVGPILGGWATTELTWRVVFAGEVVVVGRILLGSRLIPSRRARAEGASSTGSAACSPRSRSPWWSFGVLEASNWGWLQPQQLAGRTVRLLADAVRDRRRRAAPAGLRDLGAPSRERGQRRR